MNSSILNLVDSYKSKYDTVNAQIQALEKNKQVATIEM